MLRIWSRPPDLNAAVRLGFANRRSLETFGAAGAAGFAWAATRSFLRVIVTVLSLDCSWRPALAAASGFGSFLGSPSSRLTALAETFPGRGTGYSVASLARCPYV